MTAEIKRNRAPRQPRESQQLITGKQAEYTFGPPARSLYDLHTRGVLPAVRFPGGRRVWYRRADIQRLIDSSVVEASR